MTSNGDQQATPSRRPGPGASDRGPSRLRNPRNSRIAAMVDGYESTVSLAQGIALICGVWGLAGLLMLASMVMGAIGSPDSFLGDPRLPGAIRGGMLLLLLFTASVWTYWAARAWSNVPRLGKPGRLGFWSVSRPFVFLGAAAIVVFVVASGWESQRPTLNFVGTVLFLLATTWVPVVLRTLMLRLWDAGNPINRREPASPMVTVVIGACWLVAVVSVLADVGVLSGLLAGMLLALSALGVAISGAILIPQISSRHDDRLVEIVSGVGQGESGPQSNVTSQQIETAWQDSADLVQFEH